jgi:hypothetical protein
MLFTVLTALAANAQAQTPRDLDDLVDIRASSGARELEDRGYRDYKTTKIRDSSITYWWHSRHGQCIAATTKNGRYTSILKQPEVMCGESDRASGRRHDNGHQGGHYGGRGNDLNDLVGMRASGGERELGDRGYKFVNSQKGRDRIWSNWWSLSERKCVTVVTMDGRYDSVTDTLPADCDRR